MREDKKCCWKRILVSALMVQVSCGISTDITKCRLLHNPHLILKFPFLPPTDSFELGMKVYLTALRECAEVDVEALKNATSSLFIFPGTKWCGQGDVAKNDDDLGVFSATDKCCRQHDNCNDYLSPGETKHNLTNESKTTRLICDCDEELRQCLQNVNSLVSNLIGLVFFTILHHDCYEFQYPIKSCLHRKMGFLRLYCEAYELDKESKPLFQWFNQNDWLPKLKDFNPNPLA